MKLIHSGSWSEMNTNQNAMDQLIEALSFSVDMPMERVLNAVKEEVADLIHCAERDLCEFQGNATENFWKEEAIRLLRWQRYCFPRNELKDLVNQIGNETKLVQILSHAIRRHVDLEKRLSWLMKPLTLEEVQNLDPKLNCDEIYHFISYEFRSEMKIYSILYEARAVIAANANSFFLTTHEFTERAVRRLVDTVLLFANALEWGIDSYRGRTCIQTINEIHGRYHIPDDSFRFILSGIMFLPEEWNSKFGWRPFTSIEKEGWFHAMAKVGRAMNVKDISDNYEEMKSWYESYCKKHAYPLPIKRRLFDQIIGQALSIYPENSRPLLLSAILAGMDDIYRIATGYPEPPQDVQKAVKAVFFTVGHLGATLPRIPWFRTLQSNSIYPLGYKVEELGVGRRSTHLPSSFNEAELPEISLAEVSAHQSLEDLWLIIDQEVYDVTNFAKSHPGGREILLEYAGKDATEKFREVSHSAEAMIFMKNFKVGKLTVSDAEIPSAIRSNLKKSGICPFSGMALQESSQEGV